MFYCIKNHKGVSLIEVMVSSVIVGILALALATMMTNATKNTKTIQAMTESTDLKNEVEQRFKADVNLCLAQLAGQSFKSATVDKISLNNQNAAFINARTKVQTDTTMRQRIRDMLVSRYNLASSNNLVVAPGKTGCIGNYCAGDQYGKAHILNVKLKHVQSIGPSQRLFDVVIDLEEINSVDAANKVIGGMKLQRKIPVVVQTLKTSATDEMIIDCKSHNSAVSSLEICDPNNPSLCYTYEDIKPLMELLAPLIGDKHNILTCLANSGTVEDLSAGKICKFNLSGCPTGWVQHLQYSETIATYYGGCNSCMTGFHAFGNTGREACGYESRSGWGNCSKKHTGYASVVRIGCK